MVAVDHRTTFIAQFSCKNSCPQYCLNGNLHVCACVDEVCNDVTTVV